MLQFSTHIFSADISPEMLKLGRVTKVKVLFLVLVFVFHFDLFKFSAAILEKGLLHYPMIQYCAVAGTRLRNGDVFSFCQSFGGNV